MLGRECADDVELRRAVRALLAADAVRSDIFSDQNLGVGLQLLDGLSARGPQREEFLPGTKVAERYRIVSLLGNGGMGEVYRAEDLKLGVPVALKFLLPSFAENVTAFESFVSEVRLSREVTHPNVCRVYDIGQADERHFISMEFVDGENLETLLRRIGRLPQIKAIEIARQLAMALGAAHDKGVLHRDLKPANIMIDGRGQVRVTDFGLAVASPDAKNAKGLVGTPEYMAPEQLSGGGASVASDLYSLGLVLYELFTGQHPRASEANSELRRIGQDAVKAPSSRVPDIDPDVERVILSCLERDPGERPTSAHSVVAALPGHPLPEAAIRIGETPSPDVVATAIDPATLAPRAKFSVFAAVLLGIVVIGLFSVRIQDLVGFDATELIRPDAAAGLARSLGYGPPDDSTWGLEWSRTYFGAFQSDPDLQAEWTRLTGAPPTSATLWYRESRGSEIVAAEGRGPFAAVFVSRTDPSPQAPGMISLLMDARGRLLEFVAPPTMGAADAAARDERQWLADLLDAAHVDRSVVEADFTVLTDRLDLAPLPVYADTLMTWRAESERILMEAGAYRGLPVYFRLSVIEEDQARASGAPGAILGITVLVLVVTAVALGRRNWLSGRADRRGAVRMFIFIFVVSFVYWIFQAHHVTGAGESIMLLETTARTLLRAVVLCAAYVGLEPFLRARRPSTLIAWSRLVRGQLNDPAVGQSILVGALAGVVAQLAGSVGLFLENPRQIALLAEPVLNVGSGPFDLRALMGPGTALGQIAAELFTALASFVSVPLFLIALRWVLRRDSFAVAAFVLFFSVPALANGDVHAGLTIAFWCSMELFLFFRYGILTVMVGWFTWRLLTWPITLDFAGPQLDTGVLAYVLVAGLAAYGLHTSLRERVQ